MLVSLRMDSVQPLIQLYLLVELDLMRNLNT